MVIEGARRAAASAAAAGPGAASPGTTKGRRDRHRPRPVRPRRRRRLRDERRDRRQGRAIARPRRHQGQVAGPIAIRAARGTGSISGKVRLVSGQFRLGSATSAAAVTRLDVREINQPPEERPEPRDLTPWTLASTVDSRQPADGDRPRHQQRMVRRSSRSAAPSPSRASTAAPP